MAGTGQTGFWRTGVWIEPLEVDGSFRLTGSAALDFDDKEAERGGFTLAGVVQTQGIGNEYVSGGFLVSSFADTKAAGIFSNVPFSGAFATRGGGNLTFLWVPDFDAPGGEVDVKTLPSTVGCIVGPGDVFVFEGNSGIIVRDGNGRLVVVDGSGKVLCIVNPAGVVIP